MSRNGNPHPSFIAPILDLLSDAIIWVRPVLSSNGTIADFEIGYSNKPADEGINHPKGSLVGLHILRDGVPSKESATANFQHFLDVYQTGAVKEYTFYAHHARRQFETVRRMYEGGVLSTTSDRRAQREAERKEQEKTQLLNGIIEHAPAGILVYESVRDNNGVIIDFKIKLFNDVLHKLTGISKEERSRLSFKELLNKLQAEQLFDRYTNTVETGAPFAFDYYSSIIKVWLRLSVVKIGDGILIMLSDITEVKQSQQLLQKESLFSSSILDASLNGIYVLEAVIDAQGKVEDFIFRRGNQRYTELTGLPIENLLGKSFLHLFTYTKHNGYFDTLAQVVESGKPYQYTSYYAPAFNKWYNIMAVRLEEDYVVVTFNDITQQRAISLQAAHQTNLVDNILQNSSNGITVGEMIRNSSGVIIDIKTILANDAAARLTGIPKDIYLAKTALELNPAFIGSAYYNNCVNCMATGEPFITQYYLEPIGRWLEVSVSKMDAEHQIYIFTDVTSIKEAQLAIERSSERLSTIINTSQAGFFMGSPVMDEGGDVVDFRFTMANHVMAAFVGDEPQNLMGQLGSQRFVKYKSNGLFERFRHTYLTGIKQQFDFHYMGDTVEVWANIMITKLDEEVLGTFTDITQIKKLQLELEQNVEELKRSNAYLEEFAHAASHDLKEPIRKVRTFADRLNSSLRGRLNDTEAGLFERMQKSTERMSFLVDDLLTYSSISSVPLQMEEVDLNETLKVVQLDLEVQIEEKQAQMKLERLPVVKGYKRQLQQLFQNLVGNALKYSKKEVPPVLAFRSRTVAGADVEAVMPAVQADKRYHLIEIQDNGIGFEQQYAERIFGMFQRLHGRSEYAGTGIGLSIVRKVVDNHHGHIWATGTPGEGATFHVLLPL